MDCRKNIKDKIKLMKIKLTKKGNKQQLKPKKIYKLKTKH